MDKIINYLPMPYKKDFWVQTLMQSAQIQLDETEKNAVQLGNELLLTKISEKQLNTEEKLCGIPQDYTAALEDRKAAVSAKWKTKTIVTIKTLQSIADSWGDGNVDITYPNAEQIKLDFKNDINQYPAMLKAIRETMPAHIPLFASVLYGSNADIYTGIYTQVGDKISISTDYQISAAKVYTACVCQIADMTYIMPQSAMIDSKNINIGAVTQLADEIFIRGEKIG